MLVTASAEVLPGLKIEPAQAGGRKLGLIVLDADSGQVVTEYQPDQALIPASVQKILVSYLALKELGPDYVFRTAVYSSPLQSGKVKELAVKGIGNPRFTLEEAWLLARQVKMAGVQKVGRLIFDGSYFESASPPSGQRAYESGTSALSFNFNAIRFTVCPQAIGEVARVVPDPWEANFKIAGSIKTISGTSQNFNISSEGTAGYKVSGSIGAKLDCISVVRSVADPEKYFAATFVGLLESLGIKVDKIDFAMATPGMLKVAEQTSQSLGNILEGLNHYSTNMIAEQLLILMGENPEGRASKEQGLVKLQQLLKTQAALTPDVRVYDGSGLDRRNRLTARLLAEVLLKLYQSPRLFSEFETSLSVYGKSGTLKKRSRSADPLIFRGKTGSLDGVTSIAGYLTTKSGKNLILVSLQNEVSSVDRAWSFEDRVLNALDQN